MSEKQSYQCSHCGKQEATDIRYLACGSTSQWDKNNYPAPNTTYTTKDDIKIWKVALCDSCLPLSYKVFLENRKKRTIKTLGWSSFLLVISVFAFYLIDIGVLQDSNPLRYPLRVIFSVAITISFIIGIVGVPASLIILIINSAQLRNLNQTGAIAEKNKAKSFIGEGERLIKEMETNRSTEIEANFPLPRFREFKDLPLTDKEKETLTDKEKVKVINKVLRSGERSIVAVAITLQDLEKALPPEWQSILKST
jgi:hypothetical protein